MDGSHSFGSQSTRSLRYEHWNTFVFCCQIREVVRNFPFRRSEVYLVVRMTGRLSKRYSSCHANANRTRTEEEETSYIFVHQSCSLHFEHIPLTVILLIFHVFYLLQGATVFMMQTGFAMLCAGSVRQKNVKNMYVFLLRSVGLLQCT